MENATGMEAVVSQITTSLSPSAIWGIVGQVMPFAISLTLVGLGFYLINKYLRKAKKLKN